MNQCLIPILLMIKSRIFAQLLLTGWKRVRRAFLIIFAHVIGPCDLSFIATLILKWFDSKSSGWTSLRQCLHLDFLWSHFKSAKWWQWSSHDYWNCGGSPIREIFRAFQDVWQIEWLSLKPYETLNWRLCHKAMTQGLVVFCSTSLSDTLHFMRAYDTSFLRMSGNSLKWRLESEGPYVLY